VCFVSSAKSMNTEEAVMGIGDVFTVLYVVGVVVWLVRMNQRRV
jgi:hypothetical protein